jgi:hypothetical protein
VSLALAGQSLIMPLTGVSVVLNQVMAPKLLGERLSRVDIAATGIIVIGIGVSSTFGVHSSVTYTVAQLTQKWTALPHLVTTSIIVVCALCCWLLIRLHDRRHGGNDVNDAAASGISRASPPRSESLAESHDQAPLLPQKLLSDHSQMSGLILPPFSPPLNAADAGFDDGGGGGGGGVTLVTGGGAQPAATLAFTTAASVTVAGQPKPQVLAAVQPLCFAFLCGAVGGYVSRAFPAVI